MIMLHGDDRGLIVPPYIAPIQIVVVPIYYKEGGKEPIDAKTEKISGTLTKAGFRLRVDSREQYTPGWKFNEWELKGVPLRIEIGPRDVERNQVTLIRRDNSEQLTVVDSEMVNEVTRILQDIQTSLFTKASNSLKASIHQVGDYEEFKSVLDRQGGFLRACWCGSGECEDTVKIETGATIRTLPFQEEAGFAACIKCGKPGKKVAYFARAY
jgi:prolyl-tRNA synthetase